MNTLVAQGCLASFFNGMGMVELVVLGLLGILLFGKRLPEIGKNLGRTIVEFKKGLNAAGEEINKSSLEEEPKPALPESKSARPVKRIAGTTEEP